MESARKSHKRRQKDKLCLENDVLWMCFKLGQKKRESCLLTNLLQTVRITSNTFCVQLNSQPRRLNHNYQLVEASLATN